MARPSQHIDKKLIELGKKRLMKQGVSGLSIRSLCLDSGINLGMFHYYFKSKENYIRILFTTMHEDLRNSWIEESRGLPNSLEKLKKILWENTKILKEQHGTFEPIMKDINIFDDFYVQLCKEIKRKFLAFYNELIDNCKEEGFLKKEVENDKYIAIFTGSVLNYAKIQMHGESEAYYSKVKDFIDELMNKLILK